MNDLAATLRRNSEWQKTFTRQSKDNIRFQKQRDKYLEKLEGVKNVVITIEAGIIAIVASFGGDNLPGILRISLSVLLLSLLFGVLSLYASRHSNVWFTYLRQEFSDNLYDITYKSIDPERFRQQKTDLEKLNIQPINEPKWLENTLKLTHLNGDRISRIFYVSFLVGIILLFIYLWC